MNSCMSCYGTGSSFVRGWDEGQGDDAGIESVNVKPLDVVFNPRQLPYPTVVKIDVEGYELPVLHGGERILQHANVACILCEIGHRHHPGGKNPDALMVIDTLRAYGYECYGMKNSVPSIEGPRSNELGTASEFSACEPDDWPTQWICLRPDTDIHEGIFDVLPLFGLFLDLYPMPVEDLRQATSDLV